jgi:hypothetical protein
MARPIRSCLSLRGQSRTPRPPIRLGCLGASESQAEAPFYLVVCQQLRLSLAAFGVFLLWLGFHCSPFSVEFNVAGPVDETCPIFPAWSGPLSLELRTTPATIRTIADTGAILEVGQERPMRKIGLGYQVLPQIPVVFGSHGTRASGRRPLFYATRTFPAGFALPRVRSMVIK